MLLCILCDFYDKLFLKSVKDTIYRYFSVNYLDIYINNTCMLITPDILLQKEYTDNLLSNRIVSYRNQYKNDLKRNFYKKKQ